MATVNDALNSKPPLGATLEAGVKALSANQQIAFSLYRKYVFPLDGMVYWIKVPSIVWLKLLRRLVFKLYRD